MSEFKEWCNQQGSTAAPQKVEEEAALLEAAEELEEASLQSWPRKVKPDPSAYQRRMGQSSGDGVSHRSKELLCNRGPKPRTAIR